MQPHRGKTSKKGKEGEEGGEAGKEGGRGWFLFLKIGREGGREGGRGRGQRSEGVHSHLVFGRHPQPSLPPSLLLS